MIEDPPEIKLVDGEVKNFHEFSAWAMRNDLLWRSVVNYSGRTGCTHDITMKFIACTQTLEARRTKAILNRYIAEYGSAVLDKANFPASQVLSGTAKGTGEASTEPDAGE